MNRSILIIDDDTAIRKSFILAFEDTKYEIDTAESGEIGIEKGIKKKYDLIFLDLKMAGINGVETLLQLRKIDKNVPIYIVSAFHKEFFDQLKSAKDDNIKFEVINKPVGSDKILLVAKSVLEGPIGL